MNQISFRDHQAYPRVSQPVLLSPYFLAYPTLKRDAEAMARGWRPSADHLVERMVVFTLLEQILATLPSAKLKVHNGDEWLGCGRDPVAAMEEIFSVDDSTVKVWSAQSLLIRWKDVPPFVTSFDSFWIRLICGNGVDIISDYSVNPVLEQIIDQTERMVGIKPRFQ